MSIVVSVPTRAKTEWWCQTLKQLMPEWQIQPLEDCSDPLAVEYCVVWRPETGCMKPFVNLKAIISLGAGIDHVLADKELPQGIPIIRTVGTDLTQRMKEYIVLHALRHHRALPEIQAAQRRHEWRPLTVPPATSRRVGVMGLGNLGAVAAQALAALGFQTVGWSRSPKQIAGVTCYAGSQGLDQLLSGSEILICLLPLTEATRGILNTATFNRLARGAAVINAARGAHLIDQDLLEALDNGQLGGATLDVFHLEPLPAQHPFWAHPRITITPHIASQIDAPTGSRIVAANIRAFAATGTVADIADAARGY